jgi:hypothetical protein
VVTVVLVEQLGQDPAHHLVQRCHGDLAVLHRSLQRRAVELGAGHLLVIAGVG